MNPIERNCLENQHLEEWLASAVDPEIIALNVVSLSGTEAYEYLLYALPQTARRNDLRLRDGYLRRYAHINSGMALRYRQIQCS